MDISKMTLEEIQAYVAELEAKVSGIEFRRSKAINRVALMFNSINRAIVENDVEKIDMEVINDIQYEDSPSGGVRHSDAPHWRHFKVSLFY